LNPTKFVLQNEQEEAAKKKSSIITTVRELDNGVPDKQKEAANARGLANDKSQALKKLRTEVQAEEQRALDLENQAKAARSLILSFMPHPR
jgi:hypothetical protein